MMYAFVLLFTIDCHNIVKVYYVPINAKTLKKTKLFIRKIKSHNIFILHFSVNEIKGLSKVRAAGAKTESFAVFYLICSSVTSTLI